jgi:putative ABC transport system substrate-binding protein
MPVVGFLTGRTPSADAHLVVTFHNGLKETGYTEGPNIITEYRWAEGQYDRLPELAAELVRRQVAVIVAGGIPTALAAKAATTTIPVVFVFGADPVKFGLVTSLNQPGGNITGVNWFSNIVPAKRFQLLRELVPKAHTIGFLTNPGSSAAESDTRDVQAAAGMLGVKLLVVKATSDRELDSAFGILVQQQADAFFVDADLFLNSRADPRRCHLH